jgi:hypothetical protein
MGLALLELFWTTTLEVIVLVFQFQGNPLRVWDNLANVHWDFHRVDQIPRVFLPEVQWQHTALIWWASPIAALTFFVFLGLGQEAIADYKRTANWVLVKILRRQPLADKTKGSMFGASNVPSVVKVSPHGAVESYDLESKWPAGSDSNSYVNYNKHAEANASRLSVPISSFGQVSPTATQYTVSDRASIALSYDEGQNDADDVEDNKPTHPHSSSPV